MGDIAIRVEKLSKQYKIGVTNRRYDTLRDQLTDGLKGLFGRNGRLPPADDTIWALKDASFEINQGELVGVIGRNGSGKSTLLKILTRITEPTEGLAEIYGRVASLLEVGTGFHPELTGRENLYLNGAILGMRKAEIDRKFDEIVTFAEVEKFIDTPVKHYSSGMSVRLAFAVAAHLEPEILLVDEVLAVGDAAFQQKCLSKMGDVATGGRTVLFVSHNMAAVAALTQRSIWLDAGKIIAFASSQGVIEAYLSKTSSNSPQNGFALLTSLPRLKGLIPNPRARLEWVRTKNRTGNQTNIFEEGEPIVVELGFNIHHEVKDLEFGVVVKSLRHDIVLFVIPSCVYRLSFREGCYCIRMIMDPNSLREGVYSLGLKMFAEGIRQETFADVLQFHIIVNNPYGGEAGQYKQWIDRGLVRPDYAWEQIEPSLTATHVHE